MNKELQRVYESFLDTYCVFDNLLTDSELQIKAIKETFDEIIVSLQRVRDTHDGASCCERASRQAFA